MICDSLAVLQSESAGLGRALQVDHLGRRRRIQTDGKMVLFALEQQFKQQYNER
jgi:hypothetical protein